MIDPAVILANAPSADLVRRLEDIEDHWAVESNSRERLLEGSDPVPAAIVERLMAGSVPLRVWREHRGLSVTQLATAASVDSAAVNAIESGREAGAIDTMARLARALRIDLDDLVSWDAV
jgi:DNA-binding XRE family transcriptional regulator